MTASYVYKLNSVEEPSQVDIAGIIDVTSSQELSGPHMLKLFQQ